jgi:hypothetical protein
VKAFLMQEFGGNKIELGGVFKFQPRLIERITSQACRTKQGIGAKV